MKKTVPTILLALALSGCASNTHVLPIGGGQYMIGAQRATGMPGIGNLSGEIIKEGIAFCEAKGEKFVLDGKQETRPPYVLGNYPRSEIRFRCTKAEGG